MLHVSGNREGDDEDEEQGDINAISGQKSKKNQAVLLLWETLSYIEVLP